MRSNGWLLVGAFALVTLVVAGVVSTSAFTSLTVTRESTVSVKADDAALVSLIDGHPDGGLVEKTDDATLEIDLTRGGGAGANANATIELGSTDQPITDHAFRLEHRGTGPSNVTFSYGLAASTGASDADSPESLVFTLYHDAGADGDVDDQASLSENTGASNATVTGVAPDDPVYATVVINTSGLSEASDLSGSLDVSVAGGA